MEKSTITPQTIIPLIADVVLKVKQYQPLTAEEELVYLVYFENIPKEEAKVLVKQWYDKEIDLE